MSTTDFTEGFPQEPAQEASDTVKLTAIKPAHEDAVDLIESLRHHYGERWREQLADAAADVAAPMGVSAVKDAYQTPHVREAARAAAHAAARIALGLKELPRQEGEA